MSAQTADDSSDTSRDLIFFLAKIFVKDFENLTAVAKEELISSLQFIIRKTAHFSIYAALGFFSYLSVITYKKISFNFRTVSSCLFCLLYAVSDEIHQYFVPGRSCEIRDICIDFCGSLVIISVLTLIAKYSKFKFIRNNI